MSYALLSEYDRLTPEQRSKVTDIISDDGEWTEAMIQAYMANERPIDTKEQEELGR